MFKTDVKVLLVNPKNTPDDVVDPNNTLYPYSLLYLSSYLLKNEIAYVDYIDMYMEDGDQTLFDRLKDEKIDVVGFTANISSRHNAIRMIKETKKRFPDLKVVTGGIFFGIKPVETLENVPEIDFVVSGEGEETLAELVEHIGGLGPDLPDIHGITFRDKEGAVIRNRHRRFQKDLMKFDVDMSVVKDRPGYRYLFPMKGWEDHPDYQRGYPMMVGRGCVNACIYCQNQKIPFRHLPIPYLIEKIHAVKKQWDTDTFIFGDPSFCSSVDFVREMCTQLIESNANIKWYCEGRPDIDLDLLELMNKAGCICYDFALESGAPEIQKLMKRRTNIDHIIKIGKKIKELGMRGDFFTMLSLPDEGPQEAFETIKVIRRLNNIGLLTTWKPLFIVPGTKLENLALDRGVLSSDFTWFDKDYRCTDKHVLPGGDKNPHYVENIKPYHSYRLHGFHLAMQDFITKNPRVRFLRWRFLKSIAEVTHFFLSDPEKNTFKYVTEVLGLSGNMVVWFFKWKAIKLYWDIFPERAPQ